MYLEDLEASPPEVLSHAPGGAARCPYDYTYEVVLINRRLAKRMRGDDPGPFAKEGWLRAPDGFRTKETATSEFRESSADLIAAFESEPEGDFERVIPLPKGETSPLDLATLTISHWTYHDAQINYVQAMFRDEAVHWLSE